MTIIPDKHTFTIWQGATFFEVLTLYSTNDQTQPRDFYTSTPVTGITVSPNGTSTATLSVASGNINNKLAANTKYYISSPHIPAANNVYFITSLSIPTGSSYTATLYQNGVVSSTGIGNGTNEVAVITKRTINYGAEMIIRDKPQGTPLLTLSTNASSTTTYNTGTIGTNGIASTTIIGSAGATFIADMVNGTLIINNNSYTISGFTASTLTVSVPVTITNGTSYSIIYKPIVNGIHPTSTGCSIKLPDDLNSLGQIQLIIADTATATLGTSSTWKTGVYDLTLTEILNPVTNGVTTDALLYGGIKVSGV
jgi:hypothetical protein